ncbi:MAG TPA: phospholipid carrier-dependent glycosyltransferase [Thermoanaerobaculia bacterium]|nr:phospholipid carrier-dependent glycosyltransferase [Thermoanaerobaculia bacterium]
MNRRLSVGHWSVFVSLAVSLALRLFVGLTQPIDYNGYWHVFIARNLTREYAGLAHPPLFLLLLKLADSVSHSRLAYRAVPILAGVGCVWMVYKILRRVGALEWVAVLGAMAMATSASAISLSCEVQSYSLAVFLILWSFLYYLDVVDPEPERVSRRSRAAFSILACCALLAEYFAGLYLIACVLAPLLVGILRPSSGRRLLRSIPKRWLADVLTLLPPMAVGALLYELIAKPWIRQLNHLPEFYYVPGRETAAAFLTRTLASLFDLFSPVPLSSPAWAAALVLGLSVTALVAMFTEPARDSEVEERTQPAACFAILLGLGMALGLAAKYPFGGAMRQQFLLFLFALLAGFLAFDRLARSLSAAKLQRILAAACALAIAGNVFLQRETFRPRGPEDFAAQTVVFESAFPGDRTVQVDQLNLIGFFITHHDWNWKFAGREPANWAVERYLLEKGARRYTLIAHRDRWNLDFQDAALYPALRSALHAGDPPCFSVFCVHTNLYKPPQRRLPDLDAARTTEGIVTLAPKAGETPGGIVIRGNDVYAELCVPDSAR